MKKTFVIMSIVGTLAFGGSTSAATTIKKVSSTSGDVIAIQAENGDFVIDSPCKDKDTAIILNNESKKDKESIALTALTTGIRITFYSNGSCWSAPWGKELPVVTHLAIFK